MSAPTTSDKKRTAKALSESETFDDQLASSKIDEDRLRNQCSGLEHLSAVLTHDLGSTCIKALFDLGFEGTIEVSTTQDAPQEQPVLGLSHPQGTLLIRLGETKAKIVGPDLTKESCRSKAEIEDCLARRLQGQNQGILQEIDDFENYLTRKIKPKQPELYEEAMEMLNEIRHTRSRAALRQLQQQAGFLGS